MTSLLSFSPHDPPPALHDPLAAAPFDAAEVIAKACRRIAPLWPLRHFVAVNPYLGFTGERFHEAAAQVDRLFHAVTFMPLDYYRARHRSGRITDGDVRAARGEAADWLGRPLLPGASDGELLDLLLTGHFETPAGERVLTYAEQVDLATGERFESLVRDEISKWCAARFDVGQAAWRQPWADAPLYAAWCAAARVDRSPELRGVGGFRSYVAGLPSDARASISSVLEQLGVAPAHRESFLVRALASVGGWAGHLAYRVREAAMQGRDDDSLVQLLAVRLAFDGALHRAIRGRAGVERWQPPHTEPAAVSSTALGAADAALVWQLAFEAAYRRELLAAIRPRTGVALPCPARPQLQAVFCIDVRSEVLRRHLEALSPEIQTVGFAGFFGFPIEYVRFEDRVGGARCPVLLSPGYRIREDGSGGASVASRFEQEQERHREFKAMRLSTVSAFSFVETVGHFFGARLVTDALGFTRPRADGRLFPSKAQEHLAPSIAPEAAGDERFGLELSERVALAEGALRNMGLVRGFAEIVLLCGHGSETTNNPYGSGLDCGACGGHRGDVNARVAAAVLRDRDVRKELALRGIEIPDDTWFVAGLHETTTDRVELFDTEAVPPALLGRLRGWLDEAGARTRSERLPRLRGAGDADREVRRRSRDWSEVRPEWGLARNAAFIAAPRARTRGLDLDGRTFLHDYDAALDPEGRVLDLILSAPLVVASWINLQYYASTVDAEVFGSGNKTLHNVVGRHGVMLGNRSDLRPGLPWQSVHDGSDFLHEPMRLLAVVEAPRVRIETVLEAHPEVRELLDHGWVQLVAVEPSDGSFHRYERGSFTALAPAPERATAGT